MTDTSDRDPRVPIPDVTREEEGAPNPSNGVAMAQGSRAKPDLVHLLAGAFASSAPKVTSDVAYKAAVAIVCARNGRAAIEDARAHMGPIPAAAKTEIAAARAERLRVREVRSSRRAGADPLHVPFRARIPALRAKRKQAHQDWLRQVHEEGAETPEPIRPARVVYAEKQLEANARAALSLIDEREWKRAVASLESSVAEDWGYSVWPLLSHLQGESSAEQRNERIAALLNLLHLGPPDELAAAMAVVGTYHWTAADVEGPPLVAELRQILREFFRGFRSDAKFVKGSVVIEDPPLAARMVARVLELLELLRIELNEIDNPRPPLNTGWQYCFEVIQEWLANPANIEPLAQMQARLRRERKARAEERACSDAKAHEVFDHLMSGEFDDDPPPKEASASAEASGSPDTGTDDEGAPK
jgi:hypothetical protein